MYLFSTCCRWALIVYYVRHSALEAILLITFIYETQTTKAHQTDNIKDSSKFKNYIFPLHVIFVFLTKKEADPKIASLPKIKENIAWAYNLLINNDVDDYEQINYDVCIKMKWKGERQMIDRLNIRSSEAAKLIEMKWGMRIKNGRRIFDVNWMISCKKNEILKNP